MERKQLDADSVFKSYIVKDTPEHWKKYAGVITKIKFLPSDEKEYDYDCVLWVQIKMDSNIADGKKVYRNIMTDGRCDYESVVHSFGVMETDDNGQRVLDIEKWLGRYCVVSVNALNKIKMVGAVDLDVNEKYRKVADFLDENVQIEENAVPEKIPDEILHYCIIPITFPCDKWNEDFEYHACIRGFTCYESENGGDVDVKISVYVFNGSTVKVMARYFNKIHSSGKDDFDDFCEDFNLVQKDGTVDMKEIKSVMSVVTLSQNKKGNFYIDTLTPLKNVSDIALQQYDFLIQEAES